MKRAMKRVLPFLLVLLLCLAGCGGKKEFPDTVNCSTILEAAQKAAADLPAFENRYTDAEGNLDAYTLSLFADGKYTECEEYGLLDGYARYLSGGTTTYEIDVLKAADQAGAAKLEELLSRRMQSMRSGDKAMYDPEFERRMSDALLYRDGLYAILLITDDNNAARDAIDALKQ